MKYDGFLFAFILNSKRFLTSCRRRVMLKSRLTSLIATTIILGLGVVSAAQATVMLQIERLNGTHGILHATGSVDTGNPGHNQWILGFANPYTVDPSNPPLFSHIFSGPPTITIGSKDVDFAIQSSAAHGVFGGAAGFYFGLFGEHISLGDALSGSLDLNLVDGATWGAVGSSGSVQWSTYDDAVIVGTWEIVSSSVPEPTTLVLMGLGLAGFGYRRHRR